MPKMPIEFAYGDYEDAAPSVENRRVLNCYPETTPGENSKTIIRGIEGLKGNPRVYSGYFLGIIAFGGSDYAFFNDGGVVKFYKSGTYVGDLTAMGDAKNLTLATNGKNVVVINPFGSNSSDYYVYESFGTKFDLIVNRDADYGGYEDSTDVVFIDGYYLFSSDNTLYHGSNVATTDGLDFNPLSFANAPSEATSLTGMEVLDSSVYLFSREKTFIYRVAPTTPFSFARSTSGDISLGCLGASAHVSTGDAIYVFGYTPITQSPSLYKLAGSQYVRLKEFKNVIQTLVLDRLFAYQINGHKIVGFNIVDDLTPSRNKSYFYDDTESQLRGYPVFHVRGFVLDSDKNVIADGSYPVVDYFYIFITGAESDLRALVYDSTLDETRLHTVGANYSLNEASFFGAPVTETRIFEYSFPAVRNGSEPFSIKKIGFGFNDNIKTAELLQSTNGIDFVSLGEVDVESVSSNRAEWRRIGRYDSDVMFKIRTTTITSEKPMVIIDGFIET